MAEMSGDPGLREAFELDIASLPGATHVPLRELPHRHGDLNGDRPIYVLCHSGVRSLHAAQALRELGYAQAFSIAGGIAAWSQEIDPSVPQY